METYVPNVKNNDNFNDFILSDIQLIDNENISFDVYKKLCSTLSYEYNFLVNPSMELYEKNPHSINVDSLVCCQTFSEVLCNLYGCIGIDSSVVKDKYHKYLILDDKIIDGTKHRNVGKCYLSDFIRSKVGLLPAEFCGYSETFTDYNRELCTSFKKRYNALSVDVYYKYISEMFKTLPLNDFEVSCIFIGICKNINPTVKYRLCMYNNFTCIISINDYFVTIIGNGFVVEMSYDEFSISDNISMYFDENREFSRKYHSKFN